MKAILCSAIAGFLLVVSANAPSTEAAHPHNAAQAAVPETPRAQPESGDIEQMRADLERLKVLLNQMRTNLAFVQTTQTPLKHQFELETDAWQVIVEQMERRLKQMEDRRVP
jgi:hypothetical protein